MTDLATGTIGLRTQPFSATGSTISFDPYYQIQRAALYLDEGQVFVGFGGYLN